MARPRNDAKHLNATLTGLMRAVAQLMASVSALAHAAPAAAVAASKGAAQQADGSGPKQRGPGKGNKKLKSALKRSWAAYTPAQRAERVRKMLAGRGLKPKKLAKRRAATPPAVAAT